MHANSCTVLLWTSCLQVIPAPQTIPLQLCHYFILELNYLAREINASTNHQEPPECQPVCTGLQNTAYWCIPQHTIFFLYLYWAVFLADTCIQPMSSEGFLMWFEGIDLGILGFYTCVKETDPIAKCTSQQTRANKLKCKGTINTFNQFSFFSTLVSDANSVLNNHQNLMTFFTNLLPPPACAQFSDISFIYSPL